MIDEKKIYDILKNTFGHDQFRSLQKDIIYNIIDKKSTLGVLPTGTGKSLCFQLPALYFEGMTLVISPLISLMKDQVDKLKALGINAELLNSSITQKQQDNILSKMKNNNIKILYVAPERFKNYTFRELLKNCNISLIVVDEAHCISQWGYNFRPDYNLIKKYTKKYITKDNVPTLALTATADKITREDICNQLEINENNLFMTSFDRPNLNFDVKYVDSCFIIDEIISFIRKQPRNGTGIIYCLSRKDTEDISKALNNNGYKTLYYHAGLKAKERKEIQTKFMKNDNVILCATNAFGMGIDKPNIRWILHSSMPKNMELYYQEVGRAGRDGLPANVKLLYNNNCISLYNYWINSSNSLDEHKKIMKDKLDQMIDYTKLRSGFREYILDYFDDEVSNQTYSMDNISYENTTKEYDRNLLDCNISIQHVNEFNIKKIKKEHNKFGKYERISSYDDEQPGSHSFALFKDNETGYTFFMDGYETYGGCDAYIFSK